MSTKIDLSKLMTQDNAKKRPLVADKMADEDCRCHSPSKSRDSSTRSATTNSHSLLPWLLLTTVSVGSMLCVYRLEMRVRRLEALCVDLTNDIVNHAVVSDSTTPPTLHPGRTTVEDTAQSSSVVASAAPAIEGGGESVNVQWVEPEGSGQNSIDLGDTESGDVDYVDMMPDVPEANDDEWSGDAPPQTSNELFDSYLDLFGWKDKVRQLDDIAADVVHVRKRRSATADDLTAPDDDNDDMMLADDAQVKLAGNGRATNVRDGDVSGSTTRRKSRSQTTDRPSSGRQSASNKRLASQSSAIKVAHFVAPKRVKHYVSNTQPPVLFPFWQADNWTMSMGSQNTFFDLSDGKVTVFESGVYMIYAQIVYHDTSGRWAFGIYVDEQERLKCMNSEQLRRHHGDDIGSASSDSSVSTSALHSVYQHCYTSGLLKLRRFDKISLRCLYGNKAIVMQPGFTFWGLVKLVSTAD